MNSTQVPYTLTDDEARKIEQDARNKLNEYNKLNDVIGTQIFPILGKYSRVLYYPLEDEDVWGFVEKTSKGYFVCINTSLAYDKQVFVAAHELYHIWFNGCDEELILAKNLEEMSLTQEHISKGELKANRFAAAFLVDAALLKQELYASGLSNSLNDIKSILKLANLFVVPYKTMVRRLFELQLLDAKSFSLYMKMTSDELDILKNRLGIILPSSQAISLDNLVDTATSLYDRNLVTTEKLEQVLRYAELSLQDVGINICNNSITDEELLKLLED